MIHSRRKTPDPVTSWGSSTINRTLLISDLENLPEEFKVIGINDYIFLDGYEKVKDKLLLIINVWWTKFENHFESSQPEIQKWINDCSIINKKYKSTILMKKLKSQKGLNSKYLSTSVLKK